MIVVEPLAIKKGMVGVSYLMPFMSKTRLDRFYTPRGGGFHYSLYLIHVYLVALTTHQFKLTFALGMRKRGNPHLSGMAPT